jgi:hypothetical protein
LRFLVRTYAWSRPSCAVMAFSFANSFSMYLCGSNGCDRTLLSKLSIVAQLIAKDGEPDLPRMLMPETFAAATLPVQALHLDETAFAIVADPKAEKIVVRALLVRKTHRRQVWGSRILRALGALFADRPLAIQGLVPENMAPGLFLRAGWQRQTLNQFEMKIEF